MVEKRANQDSFFGLLKLNFFYVENLVDRSQSDKFAAHLKIKV
jgi:hypothetical protein